MARALTVLKPIRKLRGWQGYALALVVTGGGLLLTLALRPFVAPTPTVILILAILVSAWFGGRGPGIVAALLAALALDFFFIPPLDPFPINSAAQTLDLVIFTAIALLMSAAVSRAQHEQATTQLAADRAQRLQMVTAALSRALTPAQVAEVIMREGLAALQARTISLVLLSEDGQWLVNVAHIGYPPEVVPRLERYRIDPSMAAGEVAYTGQAVWLETPAAIHARYPERDDLLLAIGHRAVAAVPLKLEDRLLGVLVITFLEQLAFSPDTRRYISTLADGCAQALERARLYEAEQQLRQVAEAATRQARQAQTRAERQQAVTAALSQALTPPQVAQVILRQGGAALNAIAVGLSLLTPDGRYLDIIEMIDPAEQTVWPIRRFSVDDTLAAAEAVRTGQPVWVETAADLQTRYPSASLGSVRTGLESLAAVPLIYEGRQLGALALGFPQPHLFTPDNQMFIQTLAQQGAQALERARLLEQEQEAHAAERAARLEAERNFARLGYLQAITAALAPALSRQQVAEAVIEQALPALNAAGGAAAVLTDDGQKCEILAYAGLPAQQLERFRQFPLAADLPLSDAVRRRDLLLLPDRASILARYPNLAGEPAVQAAAIIPFLLEDTPLGAMSLTFSQGQTFGAADREFLWAMSRQCAQALDRAQAFSTLQERVRERSQALQAANARLQREAQEREQAQAQLSASYEQLRALTADLQGAREEERRRLSRELHDEFGGTLTGLKMDVARLQRAWPQQSAELAALSAAIDAAVQKVRGIATELRPAVLDDFGPVAAIEGLVQDFRTRMGIDCELVAEREDLNLASDANIGVYRIVQECLTNISRHAGATRVTVSLTDEAAGLVLRVQDDGQGFVVAEALRGHTLGLAGLRERVHALAGRLDIDSRPGEGTTITVTIPKPDAAAGP